MTIGALLRVQQLSKSFGGVLALDRVDMAAQAGSVSAVIGPNGAGKTSLLNAIAGLAPARSGAVEWDGARLLGLPPHRIVGAGVGYVPEGRQLFGSMRVVDNLLLGSYVECTRRWYRLLGPLRIYARRCVQDDLERVYQLFPILAQRGQQRAGNLSGGEQQMLAIGRALMSSPSILLLDEPSVGLAPTLVKSSLSLLGRLREDGLTILIVEQDAGALKIASRGYVMEQGRVVLEGESRELLGNDKVRQAYLGRATV